MTDDKQTTETVQCGRAGDHPAHAWASKVDRWCPGRGDVSKPTDLELVHNIAKANQPVAGSNHYDWYSLGVDDGGLPVHLPISHTSQCDGPTEPDPAHHYACWCKAGHSCPLSEALRLSHEAGARSIRNDTLAKYLDLKQALQTVVLHVRNEI
jgi:hypothetical protein